MSSDLGFVGRFEAAAREAPQRHYASFGKEHITVGSLHEQSSALAAYLAGIGVGRGDRVAVVMRNSPSSIAAIMAIARAGATWIPVNIQLVGEGLRYILEHSDPKVVIADKNLLATIEACGADPGGRAVITSGALGPADELEHVLARRAAFRTVDVGPGEPVAIMYTSGTTGRPKGVLVSHRMLRLSAEGATLLSEVREGDVMFVWEPLYHIGGAQVLLLPFLRDVSLSLVDRFSASRFWDQCRAHGATHIHHLGGILQLLLKQPAHGRDRDHPVRVAWGGGCRADIWRAFEDRFGVKIHECYGMTEASSFTTANTEGVVGSTGYPLPWFHVSVLDPDGRPLPAAERGEIVVKPLVPDCVTRGYFRNEDATAKALRNGLFHTGDVGSFDPDGRLSFHGRLVDSLRCRGENVSAWEVEYVFNLRPEIEDCAVVGVETDIGEMDIKLFVQPKPGLSVDPTELSGWAEGRLAPFQRPRYIAVVDAFPRTPSQRIMKHMLPRSVEDAWDRLATDPRRVAQA